MWLCRGSRQLISFSPSWWNPASCLLVGVYRKSKYWFMGTFQPSLCHVSGHVRRNVSQSKTDTWILNALKLPSSGISISIQKCAPLADCSVACVKRRSLSEKSCSTSSLWVRCTGAGQDSAESGHAYWCDLCGSSMMKRSAGAAGDPPEQVTFPSDRQTLTLTFVYCSTSTCWDVIIHIILVERFLSVTRRWQTRLPPADWHFYPVMPSALSLLLQLFSEKAFNKQLQPCFELHANSCLMLTVWNIFLVWCVTM